MRHSFVFLIAVLFITLCFAGCAAMPSSKSADMMKDDVMMNMAEGELPEGFADMYRIETGVVQSVTENRIFINSAMMDNMEVVLNVSGQTPVYDVSNSRFVKKSEIKENAEVYAWVSSAYTASLPPQTAVQVLFTNVKDKDKLPVYIEAAEVTETMDSVNVTDSEGKKWVFGKNVPVDTQKAMDKAGTVLVQKGSKCLFWKEEMMTHSMKDIKKNMKDKMLSVVQKVSKIIVMENSR